IGQNNMLDPDGDCSITSTSDGSFSGGGTTEISEFEQLASGNQLLIPWTEFRGLDLENSGDAFNGGPCNGSDLVSDGMSSGSFAYFTAFEDGGQQYLAVRIRSAQNQNSDHSFNLLLSTDGLLGGMGASADTNYLFGNAGFEKELRFKTEGNTNASLALYEVDGLHQVDENVLPTKTYDANWQIAFSTYNSANCSGSYQATFYTFYLPVTDLDIPSGMNLTAVQMVLTTAAEGASFFSNQLSDIGGLIGLGLTNPCNCEVIPINCTETYTDCMLKCLATDLNLNSSFPVEWQGITATVQNESVLLQWEVSREENNDYFTIERQIGEGAFEEIGRIDGRGTNDSPMTYRFHDPFLIHDQLYYRVRQTDFDGAFSFSPIVNVRPNNGQEEARLVHQPGSQALQLRWFTPEKMDGFVSILDVSGREYKREAIQLSAGQTVLDFQYPALPQGIYIFQVLDPVGFPIFAEKFIW
ncbi:MAG: hypothetical protein AAFQ87_04865, partial [Bacteroidota bacterium]